MPSRCLLEFSVVITDLLVITNHVATVIYNYKTCILGLDLGLWPYHIRERRHLQLQVLARNSSPVEFANLVFKVN